MKICYKDLVVFPSHLNLLGKTKQLPREIFFEIFRSISKYKFIPVSNLTERVVPVY